MSATGKICLKIDFKTNLNFSVQEMSRNFHSFIDPEILRQSVHKELEWYQLCYIGTEALSLITGYNNISVSEGTI